MNTSPLSQKTSQSSMEFISLIVIVAVISLVVITVSYQELSHMSRESEDLLVKDVALKIQAELTIAMNTENGYRRSFDIPEKLGFKDYSIALNNTYLVVESENSDYFIYVPNTTGTIVKGTNIIRKESGIIYLNQ